MKHLIISLCFVSINYRQNMHFGLQGQFSAWLIFCRYYCCVFCRKAKGKNSLRLSSIWRSGAKINKPTSHWVILSATTFVFKLDLYFTHSCSFTGVLRWEILDDWDDVQETRLKWLLKFKDVLLGCLLSFSTTRLTELNIVIDYHTMMS